MGRLHDGTLDDDSYAAHAALVGKDPTEVYNGLSIKTTTINQQNTLDVNAYLNSDCYKSTRGYCDSGYEKVGYDRDGSVSDLLLSSTLADMPLISLLHRRLATITLYAARNTAVSRTANGGVVLEAPMPAETATGNATLEKS